MMICGGDDDINNDGHLATGIKEEACCMFLLNGSFTVPFCHVMWYL